MQGWFAARKGRVPARLAVHGGTRVTCGALLLEGLPQRLLVEYFQELGVQSACTS